MDSPVANALLGTSVGAILFFVLLVAIFTLHALRAKGLRVSTVVKETVACVREISERKAFRVLMRELLQDTAILGFLACSPFILLLFTTLPVLLSSVEGSKKQRIGQALFDVGVLGFTTICCFIVIPSFALKLWRTKALQCRVANSETDKK